MTLSDLELPVERPSFRVISHRTADFGANCVKFTEDRPIFSAMKI